jgi:hypothetical protein
MAFDSVLQLLYLSRQHTEYISITIITLKLIEVPVSEWIIVDL